ncbi:MAG: nitronate monooxygenase, partial [Pseudomonadales bacterium]
MKSVVCDMLGVEFPLFAFSHCRDVVAAVSSAGGFGVLGAVGHSPETLDVELSWIDDHVNGRPYGVDLIVPTSMDSRESSITPEELEDRVPPEHKAYVDQILAKHGIDTKGLWDRKLSASYGDNMREKGASLVMDAAFEHPIKLIVNALG